MQFAYQTYSNLGSIGDNDHRLDLAWTADEGKFLSIDLAGVLAAELRNELDGSLPHLASYPLQDPFGEAAIGDAAAAFFSLKKNDINCLCGAGVNSLIAAVAQFCNQGPAVVVGPTYPDFPVWAKRHGRVIACPSDINLDDLLATVRESGAVTVFAERPSFFSSSEVPLEVWKTRLSALGNCGVITVIDESNANYCPPSYSLVPSLPSLSGALVLRGFSKAYQLGGLRLGLALGSRQATDRLRSVLPPLLACPLSLRLGRAVLGLGDIAAPLRERIAANRIEAEALMAAANLHLPEPAQASLPYLLPDPGRGSLLQLEKAQIRGKRHIYWVAGAIERCSRLSVPLDHDRFGRFKEHMNRLARPQSPI